MRITKKILDAKVARLNTILNRPAEPYTMLEAGGVEANVGHISLDHNSIYGGYILRVMSEGGGQSNFMRQSQRISAMEMHNYLIGIMDGIFMPKG